MSEASLQPDAGDPVYLDHAATSPLREAVRAAMERAAGEADFNPASPHDYGRRARSRLEEARRALASALGADRRELAFTGGGTQSDNLAVLGFARAHRDEDPRLLVSAVEHKAVLGAARQAAREGTRVERIPVDPTGTLRLEALEEALSEGDDAPTLVSVMWANNEVGTVQPVAEAAELTHRHGAVFHTDAVQALGKTPVDAGDAGVDLLTATAHKLGGPVGVGVLLAAEDVELEPLVRGGSQEGGLWPGTQNAMGAVGFAEAASRIVDELPDAAPRWREMRDELAERLASEVDDLRVHGAGAPRRLPNLLSVGIPGCDPSALLVSLDMEGVAASSGSACDSESASPSHVLEAMGVEGPASDYAVLRFSFGPDTAPGEVRRAGEAAARVIRRTRSGSGSGRSAAAPGGG